MDGVGNATGAAQRRRQRRLRSWLRHERMTVAMALAESTHHTSRGQKYARAGVWGHEQRETAKYRKPPRSQAFPVLLLLGFFLSRSQRNSWWKCRPCCLLRASRSRSSAFPVQTVEDRGSSSSAQFTLRVHASEAQLEVGALCRGTESEAPPRSRSNAGT